MGDGVYVRKGRGGIARVTFSSCKEVLAVRIVGKSHAAPTAVFPVA